MRNSEKDGVSALSRRGRAGPMTLHYERHNQLREAEISGDGEALRKLPG